jgi:uroporphyrinogen decarboxylase
MMNTREKFLEIMKFNTSAPSLKWEFGYWGGTLNHWYEAGLPRKDYIQVPDKITTPTSSLYTTIWKRLPTEPLPDGMPIMGGGLYWPTQGFPIDSDIKNYFGLDECQRMVDVNLLCHPMFEPEILEEDEQYITYIDIDGVTRKFIKETACMPSGESFPISDRASWEKYKEERVNLKDIRGRFPDNWDQLVKEYKNRDYPLALGGYPHGFFGTLAHLMGYENLFCSYHDDPELIHDITRTFTDLWIAVYEEVLKDVEVDHVHIWEDISFGKGSMVAPSMIREFMLPYMKRFIGFCKSQGIEIILLDTDGDCFDIIPIFVEAGVTGMYPFEVDCGMDVLKVRKHFPDLQMAGGIPKSQIIQGEQRIDEILQPVEQLLKTGGYIPFGDHFIPSDVPWEQFKYYREKLNRMIDKAAKG